MSIRHTELRGSKIRAVAFVVTLVSSMACGPIGPFSGGRLSGEEGSWPTDWNTVADIPEIQLETRPTDPYSINVWLVVVDNEAYIASSLLMGPEVPEERQWVRNIATDPRVRVRIEGMVYSARLETVADPAVKARVYDDFREKYPELEESRGDGARYFRIVKQDGSMM